MSIESVSGRVAESAGVLAIVAEFFDHWSSAIGAVVAILSLIVSVVFHIRRERIIKKQIEKESK